MKGRMMPWPKTWSSSSQSFACMVALVCRSLERSEVSPDQTTAAVQTKCSRTRMQMSQIQIEQNKEHWNWPDPVCCCWPQTLQACQRGRGATALAQKALYNTTWQNLKNWIQNWRAQEALEKFSHPKNYSWLSMREKLFHRRPSVAEDSTDEKHDPKRLIWHQGLWKSWQSN